VGTIGYASGVPEMLRGGNEEISLFGNEFRIRKPICASRLGWEKLWTLLDLCKKLNGLL
jgi:hypothetical protein